MRLVICEKPSVARALSAVLGARKNNGGYMEGEDYIISWCYGHLVELAPPAAYGEMYKRWSLRDLPILPEEWKYTVYTGKQKQLDTLRSLMKRSDVDVVINACDAGREGELIFRLVYGYCECLKPIKRLWINSMEDKAIREGFQSLKDGSEYDNLYHAALCRARADWLIGMNATRLFSCLYGATLSVGRVQSPTLAMLAEREAAVKAFVPEPFYTPVIDAGSFSALGERLKTREEAEAVLAACDGVDAIVLPLEKQIKTEAPPKLYDLTSLQRDANRLLAYTAQQTLDVAQALYEKKLITYPRTDSRYLTEDMADGIEKIVRIAAMRLNIASPLSVNKGSVADNTKVSDHHAIIPTETACSADMDYMPTAERNILMMLMARLVCATSEAHRYEAVTASLICGGAAFTAKGKTIIKAGWKAAITALRASLKDISAENADVEDAGCMPALTEGQTFSSVTASVREGKTSPPKRFTDDTLLAAMESAGAYDMPDDAERKGLGTPATRAGVIEKLIRTGSLERKKKMLIPTEKGVNLISILPEMLKSPLLTAEWEHRLKDVEQGIIMGAEFIDGIATLVRELAAANAAPDSAFATLFAQTPKGEAVGKCPRCGEAVTESSKGFFCISRACRFALWKDSRFWSAKGKKLDKKTASGLLKSGRVFFSDLTSEKTGGTYAATILLKDDGLRVNYILDFENGRKTA